MQKPLHHNALSFNGYANQLKLPTNNIELTPDVIDIANLDNIDPTLNQPMIQPNCFKWWGDDLPNSFNDSATLCLI